MFFRNDRHQEDARLSGVDFQDKPKKTAHWAIRLLAILVGGLMIVGNVVLLGNDGIGPRFRFGGLILGSVFLLAGVTGRGLTR